MPHSFDCLYDNFDCHMNPYVRPPYVPDVYQSRVSETVAFTTNAVPVPFVAPLTFNTMVTAHSGLGPGATIIRELKIANAATNGKYLVVMTVDLSCTYIPGNCCSKFSANMLASTFVGAIQMIIPGKSDRNQLEFTFEVPEAIFTESDSKGFSLFGSVVFAQDC